MNDVIQRILDLRILLNFIFNGWVEKKEKRGDKILIKLSTQNHDKEEGVRTVQLCIYKNLSGLSTIFSLCESDPGN